MNTSKVLLLLALLFISGAAYSQGAPACPQIVPGIGTGGSNHICIGQCAPLTTTVVTNNQTTSYNVASIPYNPYPFTGTSVLNGQDDHWADSLPIGFTFCFYGNAYTQMCIGSNGQIGFDLPWIYSSAGPPTGNSFSQYNGWSITTAMPNATDMPPSTICGAFRDIDCSQGGTIYYQYVGSSPCRALVVSWVNVPLFDVTSDCPGTPNSTFQIVLYENTNYIDVYIENSSSCSGWNGGYGIIGIQDNGPTTAVCPPNRNYPNTWTAVNEAWRFSPTGAPSYTVTWTDPGGVVGTGTSINVCPTTNTTYTATMNVTNCNGSQLTVADTVTIFVTPSTAVTVNSPTICAGGTATLTANGGTTYTWSANAGSATTSTVAVSPATTTVYTVTANNSGGGACAPIATSTVTVVPSLSVTVNVPPNMCQGSTATLTANGAANYTWTPATGLSATTGSTVTASPPTTTNYTVTGSSGSCPAATATTVVSVTPSATVTVSSATICPGVSATLTANGSSGYSWSPPTGLSSTSGTTVTGQPAATTAYTVTGANCSTPGTFTITVIPTCSITVNSATVCPGGTATLVANGGGPYTWSPSVGLSSTTGTMVTASPGSTMVYTVVSSTGGFTTSATSTVTMMPSPTVAATNTTICAGATATLTATGANTYVWAPVTGLSSSTGSTVVASPSVSTAYTVTGTAANSCTNSVISAVGVNASPTVTIAPQSTMGCVPLSVTFTSSSTSPSQNCTWNMGDGSSASGCTTYYAYYGAGTYNIQLTVTDVNNCVGTATATAVAYPVPHADFYASPQPTSILEPGIQFTDLTSNAVANTWNWNFGDYGLGDTSHLKNPKHVYGDTGTYLVTLSVYTSYGCKDSTLKLIRIEDDYELYVPTAFSPNGDGINEVFLPITTGVLPDSYRLFIFDRWGNNIFQTSDLYKGWDGTNKGEVVMEDVYVWKIELKTTQGLKKQAHGHINVVK